MKAEMALLLLPVMSAGQVSRVLCCAENVTERRRVERELYESRQMLRTILDTIPERVFWKNLNSRFLGAHRRMADPAGLDNPEQIAGISDAQMPSAEAAADIIAQDRAVMDSGVSSLNTQHRQTGNDGQERWLQVSKVPLTDSHGAVVGILGVERDITEHKRMEDELLQRANQDSLTGPPNRAYFHAQLRHAVARTRRRQSPLALLYFDIDRFRTINDTYGHGVGDEVIRGFARRVSSVLRAADFVARPGGDEFALIVEDIQEPGAPALLAEKVIAAMVAPLIVGELQLQLTTSIGIALLDKGMEPDQLLMHADAAMYQAKRAGRNCFRAQQVH